MANIFTISAAICSLISATFFSYKMNHVGLSFCILAIFLFSYAAFIYLKESKTKKDPNSLSGLKVEAISTDENDKLVIKAIGTSDGFINFDDIVNNTNLPHKVISKALDWLVLKDLATEKKGRRGKVCELTPKGRNLFNTIEATKKA